MNKLQLSTTGGLAGIGTATVKFFALFGDYKLIEIKTALANIPIQQAGIAMVLLVASLVACLYNEDKNKGKNDAADKV